MNIERAMEFIVNAQARAEVRLEKAEIRMDKIDKKMEAITKLLQQGTRMLVKTDTRLAELARAQAEFGKVTDQRLAELAQAQKATEKSLKAFIDSQRHGRNGR